MKSIIMDVLEIFGIAITIFGICVIVIFGAGLSIIALLKIAQWVL